MRVFTFLAILRSLRHPIAALCVAVLAGHVLAVSTPGHAAPGSMCVAGPATDGTADDGDGDGAGAGFCPFCTACAGALPLPAEFVSPLRHNERAPVHGVHPAPTRAGNVLPVGARAPPA